MKQAQKQITYLGIATGAFALLLLFRVYVLGSYSLLFLVWNLFLAWVPYIASLCISSKQKIIQVAAWVVFTAFLANAPYIITDLIHVKTLAKVNPFFDAAVIFFAAWLGMLLAYLAINNMYTHLRSVYSRTKVYTIMGLFFWLVAIAMYLGRYKRWNSWNLLTHPTEIVSDFIQAVADMRADPSAVYASIAISFITFICFLTMKGIQSK